MMLKLGRMLLPLRLRSRIAYWRGNGPFPSYADRHEVIFIHVPKTAGISIATALFAESTEHIPSNHTPYFGYQWASPRKFRQYFKFAFVRNPWDRLVSTYFFVKRDDNQPWAGAFIRPYPTFDRFVREWVSEQSIRSCIDSGAIMGLWPQSYFVLNREGKVMVDYLGRFEQLEIGYQHLAHRFGIRPKARLQRLNSSHHKPFHLYYTEETREIVRLAYSRDIEMFGYNFENATVTDDSSIPPPSG